MKIFNVSLRVQIQQIAELPDNPADQPEPVREKFSDDPMDKQEKILNKYLDRLEKMNAAGQRPFILGIPGELGDGASFAKNIKIAAETYEDMAAVLKKFADTAKELHAIPDGLLQASDPRITPMGPL